MIPFVDIILIVVSTYYFLTLLWFIKGTYKSSTKSNKHLTEGVSVIVSIRNGENSLLKLITDLENQIYKGDVEFVLVDDASEDNTTEIIQIQTKKDSRFKYVHSSSGSEQLSHKKRGIDAGIQASTFDILLFTDVDCHLQTNWVQGMADNFFEDADYVIGYSETRKLQKFVTIFQRVDFMMLMFSARSTSLQNNPWACSGQNQAYKKSVFKQVGGFADIAGQLQGDDSLFLHLCRNKIKVKTKFSEDKSSFVTSRPEKNWTSFLKQRIRWSGDANIMWKFNKVFFLSILATFFTNLLLLTGFFFISYPILLGSLIGKFMFELFLYFRGTKIVNQKMNIIHFIMWFFIQTPYIVTMGVLSSVANMMTWRGRNLT